MTTRCVPFPQLSWEQGSHPLERKKAAPDVGLTLLEFAPGFRDPNPCVRGHAGFVLEGELAVEVAGGTLRIGAGEAFYVAPGDAHHASNPGTAVVRLFIHSFESMG